MRLVGEDAEQLGIVTVAEALRMAEERNVDLVEIAPTAQPPASMPPKPISTAPAM